MKGNNLEAEARNLTREAELGLPDALRHVNDELHSHMYSKSASDYNTLVNGMKRQNVLDADQNNGLPALELYDSSGRDGVPDSVRAHFRDRIVSGDGVVTKSDQNADGTIGGEELSKPHSEAVVSGEDQSRQKNEVLAPSVTSSASSNEFDPVPNNASGNASALELNPTQ
jgi:hypothetical protein